MVVPSSLFLNKLYSMSQKQEKSMEKWFRWRNGIKLVDRKWTVVTNLGITIFVFRIWEWDHFHWKLDFRGLILGSRITQNGVRMQKICLFKVGWTELSPHVRGNSAARAAWTVCSSKMAENLGLLIFKIKPQLHVNQSPKPFNTWPISHYYSPSNIITSK